MDEFYVYQYIDPRDNMPFYIGKGKGRRKNSHLGENGSKQRRSNWDKIRRIKDIRNAGLQPIVDIISDGLSEDEAFALEIEMIEKYGRRLEGGILTNICTGGHGRTGMKHTEEARRKIAEKNTGKQHSEETKKRISEAKKGKTHSDEARAKMSMAKQNMSQSTKEKLRKIALSRPPVGEDTRKKMSENLKGYSWFTDGTKNIRVFEGDVIPDGYYPGRPKRKK